MVLHSQHRKSVLEAISVTSRELGNNDGYRELFNANDIGEMPRECAGIDVSIEKSRGVSFKGVDESIERVSDKANVPSE